MNARDMGTYIVQYGTNAERLALDNSGIKPLTVFHETDTGNDYKWFGAWELSPGASGGGPGGSGGAVTVANGADVTQGAIANTAAPWYTSSSTVIAALKLISAALLDIGTHTYTYDTTFTNKIATDTWVFLGTSRVKTITYNANGMPATISDWT